jgi:L-ascorbate metabolism protein UlaG (beta-lactamase superfamily)
MQIRLLRHATLVVTVGSRAVLVDPMLSPAGAMEPVRNAGNDLRIPLVDFPLGESELRHLIDGLSAVLVTHTHRDHWDARAIDLLPKRIPVFCQPDDEQAIRGAGFASVSAVGTEVAWEGIRLQRTGGRHGTGAVGLEMGRVSGFVLRAQAEPTLYVAGDTIWCDEVATALDVHAPDMMVVNSGAAAFLTGGPITMTADDVACACRRRPSVRVIAVHMEAVNHCGLTRRDLRSTLQREGLAGQVVIPEDGEVVPA